MSDFDPRRAQPDQVFTWGDYRGERHEFQADKDGVVRPRNQGEAAACDAFDLPVARKVIAKEKASATSTVPTEDQGQVPAEVQER